MASAYYSNTVHIDFASVLAMENPGNLHDLISAIDSSILSVDCVEFFALLLKLQILRLDILRLDCNSPLHLRSCDWIPCRLDIQSVVACDFSLLVSLERGTCWFLARNHLLGYDDVIDDVIIAKPSTDLAFLLKALKPAADYNQRTNHLLIL
ncbi:hypothetical protein F511_05313 [Dorcoceras hygrometricum]|uniref:Uncharacterized protein n=1 Tax=Dorcoceras hygrometricum TaxID=472368 RepID=A0A2Z7CAI3_9LAMI|nr:hypothetical protein F511_05313 [Dorcoceras hygrometricum]